MKIAFIVGSMRTDSQSSRIAAALAARLSALALETETYTLDLGKNPLPMWDEGVWANNEHWQQVWGPIRAELQAADALVLLAPEYHGMVPAALKNFLMLAADGSVDHKPALAVGVSASINGAYPITELRMTGGKNTRINFIPEHLIVRDVAHIFKTAEPENDTDKYIRARADYALKLLLEYAKALKGVRDSGVVDHKTYPNGM